MLKLAIAALLLVFSGSTLATNALGTSITRFGALNVPAPKGSVTVHVSGVTKLLCGSPNYIIDMNNPSSDLLYAQLMTAFNTEAKVDILGTGTCAPFSATGELINEVRLYR